MKCQASDLGIGIHNPGYFDPITNAVERVIDRYNREYGNRGAVRVSRQADVDLSFMTIEHSQRDYLTNCTDYYGYSTKFDIKVPEGAVAPFYD